MVNKITRETIGKELFDNIIDDPYDTETFKQHRRGSNFFVQWIYEVDKEFFPEHPELWGYWLTNDFIFDSDYGYEKSDITELDRVEMKEVVTTVTDWVIVK